VKHIEKNKCTGCGSCAGACPVGCLSMKADAEGFFYPHIDASQCRVCGKCKAVCPVINPPAEVADQNEPEVYAAWSLDGEARYESTSGGVFTELAKFVLQQGGCVAGARYNDSHLVEHAMISRIEEIALLRQSKYIQSEMNNIYREVQEALQSGRQVLFVGTPCQCAGLRSFLEKPYEKLILCDFICRGVNSPKVYSKYLEELESKYGSRVKQVWFKNKTYGWNKFGTKIIFEDGQEYFGGRDEDPFMYGYIKKDLNLYMRPSCGQCEFKGIKRPVDITLGDFWGVKLEKSNDSTDGGVSMVILHSIKGRQVFNNLKPRLYYEKHTLEEALPHNTCLLNSAGQSELRPSFWKGIENKRFNDMIQNLKTQGE
jgi:coenzyme F420-reducing hydrogenase beta subunit